MKALWIGVAGMVVLGGTTFGAEMGRQVVGGAGKPVSVAQSGPVEVVKNYSGMAEGGVGLEVGVDWMAANWKVGSEDYSDSTWAPSVALSYGVADHFDIRLDARFMGLESEANEGKTDPALDVFRLGVGARGWLNLTGDLYGYIGILLGYYGFSGDALNSAEGTLGGAVDGGVAYLVNERVYVRAGLEYEQTMADASAKDGEKTVDLSVQAVGFGIGAGIRF